LINIYDGVELYRNTSDSIKEYFNNANVETCIPILEKEILVSSFPSKFINDDIKNSIEIGGVEYATTSGTSNNKLSFFRPKLWWNEEYQNGYDHSDLLNGYILNEHRKACLTTTICSGNTCFMDNPNYDERIIENTLYLNTTINPYEWTKKDVERIDQELRLYSADLLEVNPSYLVMFLKLRKEYGINTELFQPKYITSTYEFLTAYQRQFLKNHFSCPVISFFGSTELGTLFIQNSSHEFSRCNRKNVIELHPIRPNEGIYELIVTSWKNPYMPLLRYRTRDLVSVNVKSFSKLKYFENEALPLHELHGRLDDAFECVEHNLITQNILDIYVSKCSELPTHYQLTITNNKITFDYVADIAGVKLIKFENYIANIRKWFHLDCEFEINSSFQIQVESSGKFKTIRNNLK
jgi:phenylacetate-CoA ligase